jgi:hypothetical protein
VKVRFRKFLGSSLLPVESDAPPDRPVHVIKKAKAGCFAEGLMEQKVPMNGAIVVNGNPFAL